MNLFQKEKSTSHAGLELNWKIECDAISDAEWDCLATMIMEIQTRPFSKVIGIPRGGKKLEEALQPYCNLGSYNNHVGNVVNHPILIVDDVWTTGASFREFTEIQVIKTDIEKNGWFGWCIFARTQPTNRVTALFQMPKAAYQLSG